MHRWESLLDALRERAGSDRKAAVLVGITQPSFSQWRRRHAYPSDEQARRIAELLELDTAYVLAIIHGERSKSKETRATWQRIAEAFGKAAALAIISAAPFLAPSPAQAGFDISSTQYTLRNKRRRILGVTL